LKIKPACTRTLAENARVKNSAIGSKISRLPLSARKELASGSFHVSDVLFASLGSGQAFGELFWKVEIAGHSGPMLRSICGSLWFNETSDLGYESQRDMRRIEPGSAGNGN
jgi:hypothetical protein